MGNRQAQMPAVKVKKEGAIVAKRGRQARGTCDDVVDLTDSDAFSDVTNVNVKSDPEQSGGSPSKRQRGKAPAAQFQPLLEQLRYGKLIKKIAEIRELTKAGMKLKFGEEMILPRIVVIGNESSGKSSTLERIAGQPVLPCDTGICTRAPVVLELKYDPEATKAVIYFKGFTGDYIKMKDAEEARTKVKHAMDSLKGVGVVADKEVRVKIVSQDVPTLDLVDLPGLVLAKNHEGEEPANISELTIQCAKKYIDSSNTAVVLCIVAASEPNLRTVKALGLLQESPNYEALKHSAIGVFAQSDKLYDASFEDEGRTGPRWLLEERLRGNADASVHNFEHGFVAVKNRNTRSQKTKDEDLTGCWSNEIA